MPGNFISPEGDLESIFVDDYNVIDQYAATGSLWGWGRNFAGAIGDNTVVNKSSPVQTVSGGTNWRYVTSTYQTAAIKTDGSLWLWGSNGTGELGDNTITNKSSPVQTVAGGNNWKQVYTGDSHTVAIKTDGTLWAWGFNDWGQLGNSSYADVSSPVQTIAGGNNWKSVAVGGETSDHSAAIKTDGTLWLWGYNEFGQLGNNLTDDLLGEYSPIQTISGGTNWKQVACAGDTTAAIKTDGTLWTWGDNTVGPLGDNSIVHKSSPVQTVAGGTNWKQLSAGFSAVAAIKTDGTLWLWGYASVGSIGDNTIANKSSPVQTVSGGTNWKQVARTRYNTGAIKTDGTLWVWGDSALGRLGDNTLVSKSSPVQTAAGGSNWKQVSQGINAMHGIHFYDAGNLYPNA